MTGRARHGELGGAIYASWPDGRRAVVTHFLGSLAEAKRTAALLGYVRDRGLPVPRHDLVVEIDGLVVLVQERLPSAAPRRLTSARIDAIVEINDRFAGALVDRPDVPMPPMCVDHGLGADPRDQILANHSARSRRVLQDIVRIGRPPPSSPPGNDLVHIDLSGANVLFDEDGRATAVVDWNLGAYRGDRHFALVQTRLDREWFVRSPDADPVESVAAQHLDAILADRVPPDVLRWYWACWMLHQLCRVLPAGAPDIVDWHLDLAESRLR